MGNLYILYFYRWAPRNNKCHPIPITVDLPILDALYNKLYIIS